MKITQILCAASLGAAMLTGFVSPSFAGQAELDLLRSYAGSWKGAGLLVGGEQPENFTCRMTVAKGTAAKINYAGRCSLVGINLSVSGTVAYIDAARRYEGIMSSNTAYSGIAIGRKQGSSIVFDFKKANTNEQGQEMSVDSKITLKTNAIVVDFEVEFADSGDKMTTTVPFARVGG